MLKKIVLGAVVLAHVLFLVFLCSSPGGDEGAAGKRPAPGKNAAETAETAEAGSAASAPSPSADEPPPPPENHAAAPAAPAGASRGAAPMAGGVSGAAAPLAMPAFSPGYFADLGRRLPSAVRKDIGSCRAAGVFDVDAHSLLWGKNVSRAYPIASLTKMMTALLLMEDLQRKRDGITLRTVVRVSRAASRVGGRQVWLDPRESFSLEDLLKAMMIRSANDCAYQIGEFLGKGDVRAFVDRMNRRSAELNCRSFRFYNCHGLPTEKREENAGSVEELAYLAERLWHYPELIKWSGTRMDFIREDTRPFQLMSTNHLLRSCPGTLGLKAGMTNQAGYCIVAICRRERRRVVVVVLGVPPKAGGSRTRDKIARQLVEWYFTDPR